MDYPLDKTCVTIEPLDPQLCEDCGDDTDGFGESVGRDATKKVMLDLRNNGMGICVGIYCDECAEEVASRLRDSLPDEQPDDPVTSAFGPNVHVVSESEAHRIPEGTATVQEGDVVKASYSKAHEARYSLTHAVHPDIVVLWFLAMKSHWFDSPDNVFFGMRERAKAYLYKWVETGEFADDSTLLEIETQRKFREWLESSWVTTNTVPGSLMERVLDDRVESLHKWAEGEDFHTFPTLPSFMPPPEAEPGEVDSPGRGEPAKRDVFAVIDQITALVPLHEFTLLAELARLRKTAQYKSPEAMGDVWYRGSELLSEAFPDPDALSDWQRAVVDIWMNKEPT